MFVIAARALEAPKRVYVRDEQELRKLAQSYPYIYRVGTDQVLEITTVGLESNVIVWRDVKDISVQDAIKDDIIDGVEVDTDKSYEKTQ